MFVSNPVRDEVTCDTHPLQHTPILTPATTMLAPTNMQESSLSHNKFALCLRSLLRPSSALSQCEFATRMRALILSPVPACLRSLPQPSLALSHSEFKSLYMRSLTPTPVPAGFRQSGSRPGQTFLPINGITTRAFPRPLMLTTPPRAFPCPILLTTQRVLDYCDDFVFLSHPPHFVYQLPAPLPDNSIIIAITLSVWIVLFM